MSTPPPSDILGTLDSEDPDLWWSRFLNGYSSQIYAVVHHFEADADNASDCFQYVCEQLVAKRFRRLRKFKPDGPAKFSTWLRAVVRNLCLDWHRKQFGRQRAFRSISRLSLFDREVFRFIYERGLSTEDSLLLLSPQFPQVTPTRLAESRERIEGQLTQNQRWLVATRRQQATTEIAPHSEELSELPLTVADSRPNPEEHAILNEDQERMQKTLRHLSESELLLLRLRFEQELTLEQCARVLDMGNAQRVDRKLKEILGRLRSDLS